VVRNAKAFAQALKSRGFKLVTDGTDNHMMLLDLTPSGPGRGTFLQEALDRVGITVNKNTIPGEPSSPFYPSGIRLGTPAATTRGMLEADMERLAEWIAKVADRIKGFSLPEDRKARTETLSELRKAIQTDSELARIREEVRQFCLQFPVPGTAGPA